MTGLVSLLALADSRLPAGGHAHSGGVEPAIATGIVQDLDDLAVFLRGRLRTTGLVSAALAAAACHRVRAVGAGRRADVAADAGRRADAAADAGAAGAAGDGARSAVDAGVWAALDAEADARSASPAQRAASRQQGRALLRAARIAWPAPHLDALARWAAAPPTLPGRAPAGPLVPAVLSPAPPPNRTVRERVPSTGARSHASPDSPVRERAPAAAGGVHHAVVLGAVGAAAGCAPDGVAHVAAYLAISGPAAAAVRLRGYDPFAVQALLAALTPQVEDVAEQAAAAADGPFRDLPCATAPRLDLLAELHAASEVRLFAS